MHFSLPVLALLGLAVAAPTEQVRRHVLHETRDTSSANWVKRDRVHGEVKLPMRIGLTQNNLEKGHDLLMEMLVSSKS